MKYSLFFFFFFELIFSLSYSQNTECLWSKTVDFDCKNAYDIYFKAALGDGGVRGTGIYNDNIGNSYVFGSHIGPVNFGLSRLDKINFCRH